jgi:hypothetical protein
VTQFDDSEKQVLPAIYEHCKTVYNQMEEEAKLVDGTLLWEGHLTKLFGRLHLSVPYYTTVTRELKRMGCIKQWRRGGGNASSMWEVVMPPTQQAFLDNGSYANARRRSRIERLEQQVREHGTVIAKIQTDYEAIIDILVEREKNSA